MNPAYLKTGRSNSQRFRPEERRSAQRFPAKWPLRYRVLPACPGGTWKHAHSVDMSVGGILIDRRERVPRGSMLELDIEWPGLYHDKPMVHLLLIGAVTRVERRGTVLRILRHEFRYGGQKIEGAERRVAVA